MHHQSDGFNLAVALRQPYVSDLYAVFFYFPLPLLGVPLDVFFACVALLSLNQITLHTRLFPRPSFGIFNTPLLHELHHAKNTPYADRNFGATLIVWDRIFGTYVAPDPAVPPILGIAEGYVTHDSVRARWLGVRALFGASRALGAVGAAPRARASEQIPRITKLSSLCAFVLVTSAAAVLLVFASQLSTAWTIAAGAMLLLAYQRIGAALDGGTPHTQPARGLLRS